jgi:hypothetical protein
MRLVNERKQGKTFGRFRRYLAKEMESKSGRGRTFLASSDFQNLPYSFLPELPLLATTHEVSTFA